MTLRIEADRPPLYEANDGVVRISGTRIPLEHIVRAFLGGSTPEQIAQDYDVLSLADVYAVVNYYLHHQSEVDVYLADAQQDTARTRCAVEEQHSPRLCPKTEKRSRSDSS